MTELIGRWADRNADVDDIARRPVFVFARGVPGQP
jgi:hypothetical protein